MSCAFHCHEIGGPFIAENPECPIHGADGIDVDEFRSMISRLCDRLQSLSADPDDLSLIDEARFL